MQKLTNVRCKQGFQACWAELGCHIQILNAVNPQVTQQNIT
jgi:hypothetical protein